MFLSLKGAVAAGFSCPTLTFCRVGLGFRPAMSHFIFVGFCGAGINGVDVPVCHSYLKYKICRVKENDKLALRNIRK